MSVRDSLRLCGFDGCDKAGTWHYFNLGPGYEKQFKMLKGLLGNFDPNSIVSWRGYCALFICLNWKVHLTSHPFFVFLLDREVPKPPWWR